MWRRINIFRNFRNIFRRPFGRGSLYRLERLSRNVSLKKEGKFDKRSKLSVDEGIKKYEKRQLSSKKRISKFFEWKNIIILAVLIITLMYVHFSGYSTKSLYISIFIFIGVTLYLLIVERFKEKVRMEGKINEIKNEREREHSNFLDRVKEIEEEAKQAKQEDSQPATQPATAPAAKEEAITEEVTKQEDSQPVTPATAPAVEQTAVPAAKEKAKEKKQEEKQVQRITPDFLLNTKVSIMKQHKVLNESNLYNAIITGRICKKEIEAVRSIDRQANESEYKQAKAKVLSFTPSCVCQGETAKEVKEINPLIAVDLDAKDNENITIEEMRKKINSLPFVMYSSMSVGGRGMYALLPISESNKNDFKGVFNALNEDFIKLGLKLDGSCVNVNRERYISFDDNEYWNTKCEIYTRKLNIPTQVQTHPSKVGENANKPLTPREKQKVDLMIEDIKANKIQLSKNHTDTLMIANCLANIWGEDGRELLHIIRQQRSGYDEYKTDENYTYVLDHLEEGEKFNIGFLFSKYKEAKGQTQSKN